MPKSFILTVIGTDKIGIVDHVTNQVLNSNSNIGKSRMSHLGGEFAMMLQLSTPDSNTGKLNESIDNLKDEGYIINLVETGPTDISKYSGWVPYHIKVTGADHEGVVHDIAHYFSEHQINIEDMETSVTSAPMSGTPLFSINSTVIIPPELTFHEFSEGLEKVSDQLNMEAEIKPYVG